MWPAMAGLGAQGMQQVHWNTHIYPKVLCPVTDVHLRKSTALTFHWCNPCPTKPSPFHLLFIVIPCFKYIIVYNCPTVGFICFMQYHTHLWHCYGYWNNLDSLIFCLKLFCKHSELESFPSLKSYKSWYLPAMFTTQADQHFETDLTLLLKLHNTRKGDMAKSTLDFVSL